MGRRGDQKIRVHVWMYEEDVRRLRRTYGQSIGFSQSVCLIVAKFFQALDATSFNERVEPSPEDYQLIGEEFDRTD
jgi:hypothetical protein